MTDREQVERVAMEFLAPELAKTNSPAPLVADVTGEPVVEQQITTGPSR